MHRIDTATKAPDLFGAGKHGFKDGDKANAIPATDLTAAFFNDLQENLARFVESRGIALVKGDYQQLTAAITDAIVGAQKAVTISNAVFEASVADGEVVRWDAGNNRFDEAIADGTANNLAVGIADVTNAKVYIYGECALFAGLTPGARYYLDGATPGTVAAVAPADGITIGIAKSATTLFVDIDASAGNGVTPAQFDNSTKLATTAFVKRTGIEAAALTTINTSATLTAVHCGQTIFFGAGSALSPILPAAAACSAGTRIEFFNGGTGLVTLGRQGTDNIVLNNVNQTTVALGLGDTLTLESNGANFWLAVGGSAQLGSSASFGSSLAASGYQKLPSGLILQWGTASITGSQAIAFPIAFPSACLCAGATVNAGANDFATIQGAPSTTGMTVNNYVSNTGALTGGSLSNFWWAIGK